MTSKLAKFGQRAFKFYFAFCLMTFALLVLLMNLPRMKLHSRQDSTIQPTPIETSEPSPVVSVALPPEKTDKEEL